MCETHKVTIESPAGAPAEIFCFAKCIEDQIIDQNRDLHDCLNFILFDVRELSENKILLNSFTSVAWDSWKSVSGYCKLYNECVVELRNKWMENKILPEFRCRRAKPHQLKFILNNCYNSAVDVPDKLNQYPPFSPQVYGETSFDLVAHMIEALSISNEDSFIDLGSGVGQVVLQVAASCDVKFSHGIEKADYPAGCAVRLDKEFQRWMAFYGKIYQPYRLDQGDFLSEECTESIVSSTVIFANNFAFGPEVDHKLKLRFANLKEGAKVISSKAFCSLNFRITDRKLDDIGSIMQVTCLTPIQNAVSWTDKPFSYFVHTIDRSSLERYFARLKNPKLKKEGQNNTKKSQRPRRSATVPMSVDASLTGSPSSSTWSSNCDRDRPTHQRPKKTKPTTLPSFAGSCSSHRSTPNLFCGPSSISSSCEESSPSSSTLSTLYDDENDSEITVPVSRLQLLKPEANPPADSHNRNPRSRHKCKRIRFLPQYSTAPDGATCEPLSPSVCSRSSSTGQLVSANASTLSCLETSQEQEQFYHSSIAYPNEPIPLALSQHLELTKHVLMRQFSQMRTPEYASQAQAELERERLRRSRLLERVSVLEDTIQKMHSEGRKLLSTFAQTLGILVTSPATFFSEARKLIKRHRNLEGKMAELRTEVSRLALSNQELIRRHGENTSCLQRSVHPTSPPQLFPSFRGCQHRHHHHHSHHHHHHHNSKSIRQHPPHLVPETETASSLPKLVRAAGTPPPPSLVAYPPPPNLSPVAKGLKDSSPSVSQLAFNTISESYHTGGVHHRLEKRRHTEVRGARELEKRPRNSESALTPPPPIPPRIF